MEQLTCAVKVVRFFIHPIPADFPPLPCIAPRSKKSPHIKCAVPSSETIHTHEPTLLLVISLTGQ
jgi:hypothetical protein